MCQRDNNPIKEHITAEGNQWVFNAARNPAPGVVIQPFPIQKCILVQW